MSCKKLLFALLILFPLLGIGQNKSQLTGTWLLYKTAYNHQEKLCDSAQQQLSFYRRKFQILDLPLKYALNKEGKWKLKDSTILFRKISMYSNDFVFHHSRTQMKIVSVTANELVLYNWESAEFCQYETMYFKRVPGSPPLDLRKLQLESQRREDSLDKAETLRRDSLRKIERRGLDSIKRIRLLLSDPLGRKLKMDPRGEIEIHTKNRGLNYTSYEYTVRYFTKFDSILTFSPSEQSIRFTDSSGYVLKKSKSLWGQPHSRASVAPKDIDFIWYSSRARKKTNRFFTASGRWALFTCLIVSPLISIQYKHWDFNKTRYFSVAGTSLGYALVSYVIVLSTESKYYAFNRKDRTSWKIEKLITD